MQRVVTAHLCATNSGTSPAPLTTLIPARSVHTTMHAPDTATIRSNADVLAGCTTDCTYPDIHHVVVVILYPAQRELVPVLTVGHSISPYL